MMVITMILIAITMLIMMMMLVITMMIENNKYINKYQVSYFVKISSKQLAQR